MFFKEQSEKNKELYINLLKTIGSLSRLFSESSSPFLYYRIMENIFCKSFNANNLSRSDISVDAGKKEIGIGLKTFLQNNGNTLQKVAEFDKESYLFENLGYLDLIKRVSEMRNQRIETTMKICNLSKVIYHLVTRSENCMYIFEEKMDLININQIKIGKKSNTTIQFKDDINEYSFNLSKSTLLKRFYTKKEQNILKFNVKILDDPYDFILSLGRKNNIKNIFTQNIDKNIENYIILPLYSSHTHEVEQRSGLNQWNARGRKRDENEVYIPVPLWIHQKIKGFFKYITLDNKTNTFKVKLPNGKILDMRVVQQGGKALMSNPNTDLGKWILRDVLGLKEGQLVTKKKLDIIGIDSVKLSKINNNLYYLDFLKSGSYENFKEFYNN